MAGINSLSSCSFTMPSETAAGGIESTSQPTWTLPLLCGLGSRIAMFDASAPTNSGTGSLSGRHGDFLLQQEAEKNPVEASTGLFKQSTTQKEKKAYGSLCSTICCSTLNSKNERRKKWCYHSCAVLLCVCKMLE